MPEGVVVKGSSLVINKVDSVHSGSYSCIGRNEAGMDKRTIEIHVNGEFSSSLALGPLFEVRFFAPNSIVFECKTLFHNVKTESNIKVLLFFFTFLAWFYCCVLTRIFQMPTCKTVSLNVVMYCVVSQYDGNVSFLKAFAPHTFSPPAQYSYRRSCSWPA